MKALMYTLPLFSALAFACLSQAVKAETIGADDFSEPADTAINDKAPDVGSGNWSAGAQTISGAGVLDTNSVSEHSGSFLNLTRALGAGEILTLTFTSAESAGEMFTGGGAYAGMSFYIGGSEKFFIGDPGGGQPVNGWSLDGFAGGSGLVQSGLGAEAVTGVFTYSYDTGNATLTVSDGVDSASIARTYDPAQAIDRFRIQSGGTGTPQTNGIAIDSFSIVAAVPEPASLGLLAWGALGLMLWARKR